MNLAKKLQYFRLNQVFLFDNVLFDIIDNFFNGPTNALDYKNVILLHGKNRHISVSHVAIFWVVRTRILLQ
jgi:hypothetical protein